MTNKAIISPMGGYGNHLRWLLLLDAQFSFTIANEEERYNSVKGNEWPNFDNLNNVLPTVKKEIELYMGDYSKFQAYNTVYSSIDKKLEFIKNWVYSPDRTWHNWLVFEWEFRTQLNDCVFFDHLPHLIDTSKYKTIVMTIDPILAYKSYVKFNSNLNNHLKHTFIDETAKLNNELLDAANTNNNILNLDSSLLFNNVLDRDLYMSAIEYFGLDDNYEHANELHKIWFNLHKKSEQELIQDLQVLYNT